MVKMERKTNPPPCLSACPAGVDVPRYLRFIRSGDFEKSRLVVREAIPFSAVCGYACIHPCEARCARIQYDQTLAIRLLKRSAEENGANLPDPFRKKPPTGRKVAVVGAGPSGLTAAYYLALMGHEAVVFEAQREPGGMLRYGIPAYRLPRAAIDREIRLIEEQGVKIVISRRITDLSSLREEGYEAVLIATGAWEPQALGVPGEDLPHVLKGIAFLREINLGGRPEIGPKVAVIGGGNTAVDAARASVRLGGEVTILYRRRPEDMPASAEEIDEARNEGIRMEFLTAPVKIEPGRITCIRMAPGEMDSSGRPAPVAVLGSEYVIAADTVIAAAGQVVSSGYLGLPLDERGAIKADLSGRTTSAEGIFAAGDAVTGPATIIQAIARGKEASRAIDVFLGGTGELPVTAGEDAELTPSAPRGSLRPPVEKLPALERIKNFSLSELGISKEDALYEAGRCLACDLRRWEVQINPNFCKECGYCKEICTLDIFATGHGYNSSGYRPTEAARPESCVGCLKCLYVCPDFAITIAERKPESHGYPETSC